MPSSSWIIRGRVHCVALGLLGAITFAGSAVAAEVCAPRPGQPVPLPRIDDGDEFLAQWAALRVHELSEYAQQIEVRDPLSAHVFWVRAACLAPGSTTVSAGIARTARARVHRPPVIEGSAPLPHQGDAWLGLGEPVVVVVVRAPGPRIDLEERSAARAVFLAEIDMLMEEARARLRSARFEETLEVAGRTRIALDEMRKDSDLPPRWARLELLQATAELALDRLAAAEASMARALAADPSLSLDPATTSPKVMRIFETTRAAGGGAP